MLAFKKITENGKIIVKYNVENATKKNYGKMQKCKA